MLWGRTATFSPSLVFSKTFTSTNYSGRRNTKIQHLPWEESSLCGSGGDQRHQIPAPGMTERARSEKQLSPTPTPCAQRPGRHTHHTHSRTHLLLRSLLSQVPPMGPKGKTTLQAGPEPTEEEDSSTPRSSQAAAAFSFPKQRPCALTHGPTIVTSSFELPPPRVPGPQCQWHPALCFCN